MKKFTFLASLLMMFCAMTANAELLDKYFYKISTETAEGWTNQDAGNTILTPGKDYLEVNAKKNAGRMLNYFWNESAWKKVSDLSALPEKTYSFTMDLKMTSLAARADMEFVLLPVNACASNDNRVSTHNYHWVNQQDAASATAETPVEDFFFRWRVQKTATANGEFEILINEQAKGYELPYNKYNLWPTSENADSIATLSYNVKYTFRVDINVASKVANYSIVAEDGTVVKTGSHQYVCAEDRAGIFVLSTQGQSIHQLSNIGLSYKQEGPFAAEPSSELFWVEGAERDFMVSFNEGEVLHWIQLGDAEDVVSGNTYEDGQEYQVTYDQAIDTKDFEEGEDPGRKIITCQKSGTLKMWTSMEADETNVSDDVLVEVECVEIQLPAPALTITNVSEGYGKTLKVYADNSDVVLKPTITIHYVKGDGTEGDISNGDSFEFEAAGSVQFYSWDKTHSQECYTRSEAITYNNDVEYEVAVDKSYVMSDKDIKAGLDGFEVGEIVDNAGKSHWDRIMSTETRGYKADGTNEVYVEGNDYEWVKYGHGLYADTSCGTDDAKWPVLNPKDVRKAFLPLIPSEEDITLYVEAPNGWGIFPYEGVVYYDVNSTAAVKKNPAGAAGYLEMALDSKYTSDDANKPNFYIVNITGGYNRPDKGDCTSSSVNICGEKYWLYRYDTAISSVKVMTYKGFNPGTGINNIAASTVANSAKVVKSIVNGKLVIVKDGKQFNVAGQRM